jgi:hypothetical protein
MPRRAPHGPARDWAIGRLCVSLRGGAIAVNSPEPLPGGASDLPSRLSAGVPELLLSQASERLGRGSQGARNGRDSKARRARRPLMHCICALVTASAIAAERAGSSFLFERLGHCQSPFAFRGGLLISLSALWAHHLGSKLSRLLNSRAGRQAARKELELAGTRSVRGRLGLKGSSRLSTCQQAMRTLRATADLAGFALPVRALTSA